EQPAAGLRRADDGKIHGQMGWSVGKSALHGCTGHFNGGLSAACHNRRPDRNFSHSRAFVLVNSIFQVGEFCVEHSERLEASGTNGGRFRMLVDAITDYAIYMLDPDGTVTSWNPGAMRSKGYEESEIIGENFSRFYTEEDRKAGLPKRALEVSEREGKFESEGWQVRKDGTKFWAYVVIDPIRDNAGRLVG